MANDLKLIFGDILELDLMYEIAKEGKLVQFEQGEIIIDIGDFIKKIPLLLSGAIKILREDDNGDELLLYYLERGDTCSITMTCCLGATKSEITAIAETNVELIMVPISKMEEWTGKYKSWRKFIFDNYHSRLNELLATVDSIAFMNMDQRLISYLKEKCRIAKSNTIISTHQDIAFDLHSSRVVISRLLKKLERLGTIKLHRNQIEIIKL
ncbi:Crp/Fnr family transcriptional regulator [Croceitalea marina]|uniref:Crp/Fnr family transcriptional regulator n=1 Tax=Croceitalea marina TaxID=1775166 RepID=A0ABW5N458_9FLAO